MDKRISRRKFLKFSSAGIASALLGSTGLISWSTRAEAATISKTFYITEGFITQPDGVDVYFRGFSPDTNSLTVPGAQMIAQEGDTMRITIVNTLGTSHSFKIDGVVDSGRIRGGESTTVEFEVNNAGTYLYYDGRNAPYNRLVGLHGGLAVMPNGSDDELYDGSPTFVQQYFWVFHDIDPVWHNAIRNGNTPNSRYSPRYFTLNGLSGRPPGAPGAHDPDIDSMYDPRSQLRGSIGDRALIRVLNPGMCQQSVHCHGNHVEWLTDHGRILPDAWSKDCVYLEGDKGQVDIIYPFESPPDAYPPVNTGHYPMHLHTEMSQTAGGGLYMFGSITEIILE
jgi:FtsP/CotA-like multicopper oxidase with cupredoxin domain